MKTTIKNIQKLSIREQLIVVLFDNSKNVYRNIFKRNSKGWNISLEDLLMYENNSLGKDLANFLVENNFKIEPKLEKHDIYHVLTNYPTTVLGEICLSLFNIGTGKKTLYTYIVATIGALIMFENYKLFIEAYKKGKSSRNYTIWDFQFLLKEKTTDLQNLLFNKKNIENGII